MPLFEFLVINFNLAFTIQMRVNTKTNGKTNRFANLLKFGFIMYSIYFELMVGENRSLNTINI